MSVHKFLHLFAVFKTWLTNLLNCDCDIELHCIHGRSFTKIRVRCITLFVELNLVHLASRLSTAGTYVLNQRWCNIQKPKIHLKIGE